MVMPIICALPTTRRRLSQSDGVDEIRHVSRSTPRFRHPSDTDIDDPTKRALIQ